MAEDRLTLVVNLGNKAASQYTNYDFNSFAYHHPTMKFYGASSDGLYTLDTADTDNTVDIACYLKTMKANMGAYDQTNFLRAYMNFRATDTLEFTSTADGWDTEDTVEVPAYITDSWHGSYIDIDRGMWGSQWSFKVANANGCDLSVRSLGVVGTDRRLHPVFEAVAGVNNRLDPALLKYDARRGIQEMAEIVNMYVDDSLHAHRRRGCTLLQAGSYHSLFSSPHQNELYVMYDFSDQSGLMRVMPDGGVKGIRSGMTRGARVHYTWYDGVVYYTNGYQNGRLIGDTSYTWPLVSPHAREITTHKQFYAAPTGTLLANYNGRVYMAQGDTVWFSEYGSPSRWRLATAHMKLEGNVTLLEPSSDGLYVGDSKRVYMMSHQGVGGVARLFPVSGYPAILGTSCQTEGSRILGGSVIQGQCVVWTSTEGICVGGQNGIVLNLTEKTLAYPRATEGSGIVVSRHGQTPGMPVLYITSLAA